jgi:hypothetical protein
MKEEGDELRTKLRRLNYGNWSPLPGFPACGAGAWSEKRARDQFSHTPR